MIDEFVEKNNRRWKSQAYTNKDGVKAIVVSHPGIANWCAPDTDPSKMVKRVIAGSS